VIEWEANRAIHNSILECIGRTPMVSLKRLAAGIQPEICVNWSSPIPAAA